MHFLLIVINNLKRNYWAALGGLHNCFILLSRKGRFSWNRSPMVWQMILQWYRFADGDQVINGFVITLFAIDWIVHNRTRQSDGNSVTAGRVNRTSLSSLLSDHFCTKSCFQSWNFLHHKTALDHWTTWKLKALKTLAMTKITEKNQKD